MPRFDLVSIPVLPRWRYWTSRGGAPRLRYLAGLSCVVAALGVAGFAGPAHKHGVAVPTLSTPVVVAQAPETAAEPDALVSAALPAPLIEQEVALGAARETSSPGVFAALLPARIPSPMALFAEPEPTRVTVQPGGTLAGALEEGGLTPAQAYRAVEAASAHLDPRRVRAGQEISVLMDGARVEAVTIALDPVRTVTISESREGAITATLDEADVVETQRAARGTINGSLYGAAAKAGVPDAVIARMIKIYSWDVDFQRDVRAGDGFEVLYTTRQTAAGVAVGGGQVLYAQLHLGGRDIKMYRFADTDGVERYFGPDGRGIRKALMRTPVDGGRMTSGFGMRKHPILGYSKMHKGVDFAAPTGTPVYAAGDGVVERASRFGSYGNYVRIRHAGGLKTAYAHLLRFARGVKPGTRVEQGQVVAYVGTTGRSTGPHLHYEVIVDGKQVNPATVKQDVGGRLAGAELEAFRAHIAQVDQRYAALSSGTEVQVAEAR